ncbi:MAG: DUF4433 domain-containing protein [Sedimentisphaerales bacterium]|nr:DUF4433 domain-containing protein [Sedimentisphaerales bacterium]
MKIYRKPKIYHITHIDNLDNILRDEVLWSDAKRLEFDMECEIVGMSEIKRRRLGEHEVKCHSGTMVGEYVPFYFCPRSIMLYILHMGNHPDISYRGGQNPILHLQADLEMAIQWANANDIRWAFSDINAGNYVAQFYNDLSQLNNVINWSAVEAADWRAADTQEYKQAEFLIYESFPWELVEKIGVCNHRIKSQVIEKLGSSASPEVSVERDWYY